MDPRLPYLDAFAQLEPRLAAEPDALRTARRRAFERFTRAGFPTGRDEAWRFTSLEALLASRFAPAVEPGLDDATSAAVTAAMSSVQGLDQGGPRLVFVDGHLAPALSSPGTLPDGVILVGTGEMGTRLLATGLSRDAETGAPFSTLNAALTQGGALLRVPAGRVLEAPVLLVFVATRGRGSHPRTVVTLEPGSRATVVEAYLSIGPTPAFTNAVTEVTLEAGAALDHFRVSGGGSFHVGRVDYRLGRDAELGALALARGGLLQRHDLVAVLENGASASLRGLSLAGGEEHVDHHTLIDHAAPGGRSRETYKGVFDGRSHGVFEGAVLVRPAAQRTDAVVASHNLLLSDDARVNSKPQFNIHADDVKCSHGATVGQLRAEELFYLRSRGIPAAEARALLLQAFAAETLADVRLAPLREALDGIVMEWLPREREAA